MTDALVPVFAGTIQSQIVQLCDARALHAFMEVRRDFSNWVKGRIRKFGFAPGEDYLLAKSGGNSEGRPSIEYHLTLDMAKELSMVENNAKGREARRYFINCEKAALQAPAPAIGYERLTPADKQAIRQAVAKQAGKDSATYQAIYEKLHTHFRVNSYHEIAAGNLTEALEVIGGSGGNSEALPTPGPTIDPLDARAMVAARKVAGQYFEDYRDAVKTGKPNPAMGELPQNVLHGMVAQALFDQRMLSYFDWTTGKMHSQLVPGDSSVFSFSKGDYCAMAENIPMERIPEALEALNCRVKTHLGAFSNYLQRNRTTTALTA